MGDPGILPRYTVSLEGHEGGDAIDVDYGGAVWHVLGGGVADVRTATGQLEIRFPDRPAVIIRTETTPGV